MSEDEALVAASIMLECLMDREEFESIFENMSFESFAALARSLAHDMCEELQDSESSEPIVDDDEIMLRRWCVEQAARWPMVSVGGNIVSFTCEPRDCDVLGRAQKLYDWVMRNEENE